MTELSNPNLLSPNKLRFQPRVWHFVVLFFVVLAWRAYERWDQIEPLFRDHDVPEPSTKIIAIGLGSTIAFLVAVCLVIRKGISRPSYSRALFLTLLVFPFAFFIKHSQEPKHMYRQYASVKPATRVDVTRAVGYGFMGNDVPRFYELAPRVQGKVLKGYVETSTGNMEPLIRYSGMRYELLAAPPCLAKVPANDDAITVLPYAKKIFHIMESDASEFIAIPRGKNVYVVPAASEYVGTNC